VAADIGSRIHQAVLARFVILKRGVRCLEKEAVF